ncbi:ATP-binding protein [Candidatus Altiarchaeota archaeon]
MTNIKQLTVISGKGGTGKTSIVGAFACLAKDKVLADCDVDAADLHLLLHPSTVEEQDFKAMKTARIDDSKCIQCGRCVEECRFQAIKDFHVEALLCEGCGVCRLVCPNDAVILEDTLGGKAYVSDTRYGPLCHARLSPGEEASGKLVTLVRGNAKKIAEEKGLELIIIDGSPGIGCPVIASIGGVDLALIITEPTLSGIHDLERILAVVGHFNVEAMVCINKYDINPGKTRKIEEYCRKRDIILAGKIPYNIAFTKAMVEGKTITEYADDGLNETIKEIWTNIDQRLRQ